MKKKIDLAKGTTPTADVLQNIVTDGSGKHQ